MVVFFWGIVDSICGCIHVNAFVVHVHVYKLLFLLHSFQEEYSLKRRKSESAAILIEVENEVHAQDTSGKVTSCSL